ncbi:MAG TPA: beta-N-acetylhexosaminidase [Gemmatimonadaceae bacterium]|nr:beta-N-acetylhexosaminidase [Gemmatimonadaceae bacterium]
MSTVQGYLRAAIAVVAVAAACSPAPPGAPPQPQQSAITHAIVPVPSSVALLPGESFLVDSTVEVVVEDITTNPGDRALADQLATLLRATGSSGPMVGAYDVSSGRRRIVLARGATGLGPEGYDLTISGSAVRITAESAPGLFYGIQTIRQLLPSAVEHPAALSRALRIPAGHIKDAPRFTWRGAMLDVSRHFLSSRDVKGFIDLLALYKMNRLHLHLSDDQGWRIEIKSWPNLTAIGGRGEVGGGQGGFYTQDEFRELVSYAAARFVTIVPEIDMPGHTNAALASYGELNCDGVARAPYAGIRVGFSALCAERDTVYRFVSDVVREIGALTPAPWFHIGGDEVEKISHDAYRAFIERVQGIVQSHGKVTIGWGEISPANLSPATIVQHWKRDSSFVHAARGGKVILSPSKKLYLDMKYDSATVLGLKWAAIIDVRDSYDWEPGTYLEGVPESSVLGIEAPLWSETLEKRSDFEYMAFPRLAVVAELGWSAPANRSWENFRLRLAAHGPRLSGLGVNFYRSPQIPWLQ